MNIKILQEIAERYGFVIAETEEEAKKFEELGYCKVEWDLKKILPELAKDLEDDEIYGRRF